MSAVPLVVDRGFIKDVIAFGGEGLKKCYQCGTCTAICPLSEEITASFRKVIEYTRLGLSEKVLQMPIMWICAECRDCVAECPRDANPSRIMAALRRYCLAKCSWYGLVKALTLSPKLIFLMALIPAALIALVIATVGRFEPNVLEKGFEPFIPSLYVDIGGVAIGILVAISVIYNLSKLYSYMRKVPQSNPNTGIFGVIKNLIKTVIYDVLLQKTLKACLTERRWPAHMMVFWGFVAAGITTGVIFIFHLETPLSLTHPIKILGNISFLLLFIGGTILLHRRITRKDLDTVYFDWLFLILLYVVTWTGFLTQFFRLLNSAVAAYALYFIHLVTVSLLLVLAPHTKFAHAVYRPFASFIGRIKGWVEV